MYLLQIQSFFFRAAAAAGAIHSSITGKKAVGVGKWLVITGVLVVLAAVLYAVRFPLQDGRPTWLYQLQNASPEEIASLPAEYAVIDPTKDGTVPYTPEEVGQIRKSGAKPLAYLSIGEASSYLPYWKEEWGSERAGQLTITDAAPEWAGTVANPDWPESVKVRYWNPEWQQIVLGELLDIREAGFSGVYLDIIDGYEYWGEAGTYGPGKEDRLRSDPKTKEEAAHRMTEFVRSLSAVAKEADPDFLIIPQNAEELIGTAEGGAYLDAVDGIGVEDVWYDGNRKNRQDVTDARLEWLSAFTAQGKIVLSVDYTSGFRAQRYYRACRERKFFCYAADPDRSLSSPEGFSGRPDK